MIEICRRHLVPNGVAFISYNTYPGWHIRGIVRDMMRFHGGQFADPATRLAQAKALVEFVVNSSTAKDSPYERLLRSELDFIGKHDDYYLHHDHLEEHNLPLYFHQFARKLAVNGLQYLGDADFVTMVSTNFAPEVAQTLQKLGAHDIVQMEQYMDYVRCRYFRQTLICHRAAQLNRHLGPDTVKKFFLATNAAPAKPDPSLAPTDAEQFKTPGGVGVTCQSPLTKLALLTLGRQWPMPVAFADLFARCKAEAARKGYPADSADAENVFAGQLLTCMAAGLIEWRLTPAPFTTTISERPAVTPLARFQASEGPHVTNLRGENATLDEFHRQVVSRLDGTRNREQLIEEIMAYLRASGHSLHRADTKTPITDEKEMRVLLDTMVDKAFQNLAKLAVLIPEKKT
jgi:methyltransferase-like protein